MRFVWVILLLLVPCVSAELVLPHVAVNEYRAFVSMEPEMELDRAEVTVIVPELGIRSSSVVWDADKDSSTRMYLDVPADTPAGEYLARISVYADSGDCRRIVHRYLIIE